MAEQQIANEKRGIYGWAGRHPKATFFFVILIIVVVFVFLFDRSAKNQLNRLIAEARARGEPMSVDDLNAARSATPASQNPAFILLNEAACFECNEKLPEDVRKHLPIVGQPAAPPTGVPLSDEQREAIHTYFASMEGEFYPPEEQVISDSSMADGDNNESRFRTMQELRHDMLKVLAMPGGHLEYQAVTPMMNMVTPELAQYRVICKFFSVSCLRHMDEGDGAECLIDLQAQFELSRQLDVAYPSLIQTLVALAIEGLGTDMIERAVNRAVFDAETIALLEAELGEMETTPGLRQAMMWERVNFLDTYEWLLSGGGIGPNAPQTSGALKLLPVVPSLDVSSGLKLFDYLIKAATEPVPNSLSIVSEARIEADNLPAYHLYSRMMLPSLTRPVELWLRGIGSKRALIAALACERYRLANGNWPESLTNLVPEYLKAVPADPFDGAPIRYAVTSEGIELWCIGEDLKDDGGDIKRRDKKGPNDRPTDGGWLILNPDLRGKPLPEPASAIATSSPATQSAGN